MEITEASAAIFDILTKDLVNEKGKSTVFVLTESQLFNRHYVEQLFKDNLNTIITILEKQLKEGETYKVTTSSHIKDEESWSGYFWRKIQPNDDFPVPFDYGVREKSSTELYVNLYVNYEIFSD